MTNRIAIALAAIILAVFLIDAVALGGTLPLALGRKVAGLIEYLAFWR